MPATTLINTVGTSLLSNLRHASEPLTSSPDDPASVARALHRLDPTERVCGAEINAITRLKTSGHVVADCDLHFLHSATPDGRQAAAILQAYYRDQGHRTVVCREIADLRDDDPRAFRTRGLRQLVGAACAILRERSPQACAINATGGYKAQIALAVVIGQALGVPVYYLHETFAEIIAIPPMPVALDRGLWQRASGMLDDLSRSREPVPLAAYAEDLDETTENLVERVMLDDGETYLDLSPVGLILHDTMRDRHARERKHLLPAARKQASHFEKSGWPGELPRLQRLIERLTEEVPFIVKVASHYYNPDLPQRTRCRFSAKGPELVWSDGTATARFHLDTTAADEQQAQAVVAEINAWLSEHHA